MSRVCGKCKSYGQLTAVQVYPPSGATVYIALTCRKCGHKSKSYSKVGLRQLHAREIREAQENARPRGRCKICSGPVKAALDPKTKEPVPGLWLHDNSWDWYEDQQIDHDPEIEEKTP